MIRSASKKGLHRIAKMRPLSKSKHAYQEISVKSAKKMSSDHEEDQDQYWQHEKARRNCVISKTCFCQCELPFDRLISQKKKSTGNAEDEVVSNDQRKEQKRQKIKFGPEQQEITCPHCHDQSYTTLIWKTNVVTTCLSPFTCFLLPWCCVTTLDAEHQCIKCNEYVGSFRRFGKLLSYKKRRSVKGYIK